ncbi:hypothetical protein [Bacillus cereus]
MKGPFFIAPQHVTGILGGPQGQEHALQHRPLQHMEQEYKSPPSQWMQPLWSHKQENREFTMQRDFLQHQLPKGGKAT